MTGSAKFLPKRLAMSAAIVLGMGMTAWTASAETLTDALIAAYRNSNLLEQNRAVLRAADEDVAVAVSTLRPVISFLTQGQYGYAQFLDTFDNVASAEEWSGFYALSAQMTLYDFGRTKLAIEATKEVVLATREALLQVEQQVLLAAVVAYVDVRLREAFVDLRQNNVRVIGEQLKAAQDRFDVGEVTRTDVAQAEARLAQANSNLIVAEGELQIAREAYRAATGAYPGNLAPLPPLPATASSLEAARSVALRTHPAIRQAQRQVSAADLNVARAKADMRPTIGGEAQLQVDDGGLQQNGVGINFSQTLYAGGRLAALVRQAMANRDSAYSNLQQSGVIIGENVGVAWTTIDSAVAAISATETQIEAAQIAFDGVSEEASLGARTTLDVLDAEQDLLDARAAKLEAEAARYKGVYQLLASMGLLTVEHLRLGIPTYDPAVYYNAVRNAPAHSAQGKKLDRIMKSIGKN
jgi:outer membrane protein